MDDFHKGWSQGMTGSTNGLPSQSVLEKMGRDAASNHWNNNNQQQAGGYSGSAANSAPGTPITTVLYEAGKNMQGKNLLRHFIIATGLMVLTMVLRMILPVSSWWALEILAIPGFILMAWVFIRLPFYGIARIGSFFEKKKAEQ